MRRRRLLGTLLAAALGAGAAPVRAADPCADFVPQAKPQNAGRDIVGQDIDQILDRGFMTFAVYEDFPPYSWEEAGQPRGVDIEIAQLIAEDIGVEPQFRFVAAGETLEADLRNNIWKGDVLGGPVSNVMMRVPYDSAFACRVEQAVFTGRYASEDMVIAYREEAYPDDKPIPAYFRFDTVAVENDSLADFYLSSFAGGQTRDKVLRYPSMDAAMKALSAGETMAAMGPRAQVEWGLGEGTAYHVPPLAGLARGKWELGVAVNFRYRALGYMVDDAIRAASADGRIAKIYAGYGLTWLPVTDY
ncbi:substrate-binding periplasmic protein [Mesobacterium pallidum]|uniref:substrate-binding periplasmic protein n=1 Tax=Mesobacterium pallidum TaxID=2872037 RepID=UPI001EE23AAC|nr:transporter substrate-binding domain-containing protein [Mesobacterium pallidum]